MYINFVDFSSAYCGTNQYHMPSSLRLSYTYAMIPTFHTPIPGPTRLADLDRVRGARPYTGTLYLIYYFFFKSRTCTCGYGPHIITESKWYIQIKRTTTGVVSIKIYTHITESHLFIQNCSFTFTNQSTEPTCSEPLQVCWPNCMQMFADVFSCTYTD